MAPLRCVSDTRGMVSGDKELRCVIVDDDPRYIAVATRLLERGGISIIGAASTIAEAVQRVEELRPDITLVDVNLGGESGLHLALKLHQANSHAGLKIILTSAQSEQDFADMIAASPAVGFVPKDDLSPDCHPRVARRQLGRCEQLHARRRCAGSFLWKPIAGARPHRQRYSPTRCR